MQDSSRKTVIGLLDIYGFEVFDVNRWHWSIAIHISFKKTLKMGQFVQTN